ncbi:MAG: FtsX-like permease family protein, partial [Vicinamibacterales bacterium]
SVNLGQLNYTEGRGRQFYDRLREEAARLPGATAVSLASYLPFSAPWMPSEPIAIDGRERPAGAVPFRVGTVTIDPAHLQTLGIALRRGRNFTAEDTATAPAVALVSETMARRFWPDEEALGQRVQVIGPLVDSSGVGQEPPRAYRRVVGIVEDITYQTLSERPRPVMYLPFAQRYVGSMSLVVRTASDPAPVAAPLRQQVRALDEHLPIDSLQTLAEHADVALGLPRILAGIVGFFGGLAIVLAAVGLYGLLTYAVGQRTREFGIRVALGADRRAILRLVLGDGMALVLIGIAVGLPLAIAARQVLWRLLHTLTLVPGDPLLFAGLSLLLSLLGLLASYLPGRRATKVDPLVALRTE